MSRHHVIRAGAAQEEVWLDIVAGWGSEREYFRQPRLLSPRRFCCQSHLSAYEMSTLLPCELCTLVVLLA